MEFSFSHLRLAMLLYEVNKAFKESLGGLICPLYVSTQQKRSYFWVDLRKWKLANTEITNSLRSEVGRLSVPFSVKNLDC